MKSCLQIATELKVTRWTVWNWCKKLGLERRLIPKDNGGMIATLDDDDEKILRQWLVIRKNDTHNP